MKTHTITTAKKAITRIISLFIVLSTGFTTALHASGGANDYAETEYPIVLVHGFLGFDTMLGVIDYWYKVPATLEAEGGDVHVALVSPTNSPEARGEQLITQIEDILAITGANKVNLMGHSHGSPTSRYVASVRPDLVASVTGISGVNNGVEFADAIAAGNQQLLASIVPLLSSVIAFMSGNDNPNDAALALASMSTENMDAFNIAHPGGTIASDTCGEGDYVYNGIRYYSWSGNSRTTLHLTNPIDLADLLFAVTGLEYNRKNDGLVASCTSHLGKVIRDDFYFNHLDSTNGLLGLTSILAHDPVEVIMDHANRLKGEGL